ncbi:MAG: hypothetical protein JSS12_00105 [Verrucomicrobia bacterium]|nr:hypothetical protein [Verrucomicrobiota bacterium]
MGVNIGGNQPNVPGMPTGPTSEPKHAADVDPNKLLLMLPDLDKRARELGKLSKATDQDQEMTMDSLQDQALVDFAKSLISEPDLPEGSKAALEKWITQILSDDTAATTTPTQTGDTPDGAPQTRSATTTSTPQTSSSQGTQTPGQPAGTTNTTTTSTATKPDIPMGGDPSELLTDGPEVQSAPVKALGKMASTIATAQGGKLTPEQVTILTQEANTLMGSPNMSHGDTAMLQSFVGQLAEFPKTTDDPKSPTKSPSQPQAQSRSAKAPDMGPIAMDEFGLSSEVQDLGQKAMSLIQGNGGKVSERDAKQLEEAAQALIDGGADGDDLKALQNFINALAGLPRSGTPGQLPGQTGQLPGQLPGQSGKLPGQAGASPQDSQLLMDQPGINPRMAQLGQLANSMMKAQNNTLTQNETELLGNVAQELLSQDLSAEEKMILQNWLGTLAGTKTQAPPQAQVFTQSMLFAETAPARNPFMSPGIMTMLASILAEIMELNNEIIRQSSKLKQSMMKLLVSMANEAFKLAITAGQAKAAQLEKEATMYMALGISQCVQAGMSIASFGSQRLTQSKFAGEAKGAQMERKLDAWATDKSGPKGQLEKRTALLNNARTEHPNDPAKQYEYVKKRDPSIPSDVIKQTMNEKMEVQSAAAQRTNLSGAMAFKDFMGHLGQATDNFIQGGFKASEVQDVLREASANAYNQMITQLMQLINGTIQSATDEGQAAQRNFESFSQLYRDFANTITQGIYRSG